MNNNADNQTNGEEQTKVFYKGYSVFNSEQTQNGATEQQPAQIAEVKQITTAKTEESEQKTLNLWDTFQTVA